MRYFIIVLTIIVFRINCMAIDQGAEIIVRLQKNHTNIIDSMKSRGIVFTPVFVRHYKEMQKGKPTRLSRIFEVSVKSKKPKLQVLKMLKNHTDVMYAELKPRVKVFEEPNDPKISSQYYLEQINIFNAWGVTKGDSAVIIGIVDTGTDFSHDDVGGKIAVNEDDPINGVDDDLDGFTDNYNGWDLGEGNNNPQADVNGHGVRVAGICAAKTNNDTGIAGVGYNVRYLPVKVMNDMGQLNTAWEGIVYAADQNVDVIVCSWGGVVESAFAHDIVKYAVLDQDAVVVAAAGNSSNEDKYYPASYPEVIAVAGTNENDQKWSGSTYGYQIDISAPGETIYSTTLGNGYANGWGTSYAAPVVGGVAALVRSQRPQLNAFQVAQQLKNTAYLLDTIPQNVVYANKLGSGRVDAFKALTDTMISGIDIINTALRGNALPEHTVYIEGTVINYLKSSAVSIQVESLSDFATIDNTEIDAGVLNTNATYDIRDEMLPVTIHEDVPYDQEVTIKFRIDDGQKQYNRFFTFTAHQSWINLTHNNLKITVPANGKLGFNRLSPVQGKGIWLGEGDNMIWEAGLIYGNSSSQVVSTFFDKAPLHILACTDTLSYSDDMLTVQSQMIDTSHNNALSIKTTQKIQSISNDELSNTLLITYQFINEGVEAYENFHAGLFFDWDLESASTNTMHFDDANQIAFCENLVGNSLVTGVKVYDYDFHHYAFDLTEDPDGINIIDDFTDEERWFALSNERTDAGTGENGNDVAHIIGTDGFQLLPGDTAKIVLIVTAGYHQSHVTDDIVQATYFLNQLNSVAKRHGGFGLQIFPNPAQNSIRINSARRLNKITFYDLQGRPVKTENVDKYNVMINLSTMVSGVYFVDFADHTGQIKRKKIIINKSNSLR